MRSMKRYAYFRPAPLIEVKPHPRPGRFQAC